MLETRAEKASAITLQNCMIMLLLKNRQLRSIDLQSGKTTDCTSIVAPDIENGRRF